MTKLICICFLNIVCLHQNVLAVDIQREKWGVETNGIRMAIQLDESTRPNLTNKDVVILFRLNNVTTNETFEIYQSHGFDSDGCSFEIAFSSGEKSILPAKYYAGSGAFYQIKPSQVREYKVNISKLFHLNEPGTYTIIAKRNMVSPETGKVFVVVSNQLKVSTDTPIIAPAVPMKN